MDAPLQEMTDSIVEDEVVRGYRDITVPPSVRSRLTAEGKSDPDIPDLARLRLLKLTPRRRREISELVARRYQADLQDKALLSNAQLRRLNIERGEWSLEQERRMEELREQVALSIRELFGSGSADRSEWAEEITTLSSTIDQELTKAPLTDEERLAYTKVLTRWLEWRKDRQAEYTREYAAAQGKEEYSYDADTGWLHTHAPSIECAQALLDIEDVQDRIREFLAYIDRRAELATLTMQHAKIFSESVEQRRDNTEELARLFFCTESVNQDGKGTGKIVKDFETMWDLPEEFLQWLIVEAYFFFNGVPEAARKFLEPAGFTPAPLPLSGSRQPPVESHAEPTSSSDSPPVKTTPAPSSASSTATS